MLAFRSHCLLDYGEYEVLFGVSDANDPALALVEKLQEEFPLRQLRVMHCPEVLGLNGKVSNLAQMLPQARTSTSSSMTATSWCRATICSACWRRWRIPKSAW